MDKLKDFAIGFGLVMAGTLFQFIFMTFAIKHSANQIFAVLSAIVLAGIPIGCLGLATFFIKKRKLISTGIISALLVIFGLIAFNSYSVSQKHRKAFESQGAPVNP